jgi:hypothetical protein
MRARPVPRLVQRPQQGRRRWWGRQRAAGGAQRRARRRAVHRQRRPRRFGCSLAAWRGQLSPRWRQPCPPAPAAAARRYRQAVGCAEESGLRQSRGRRSRPFPRSPLLHRTRPRLGWRQTRARSQRTGQTRTGRRKRALPWWPGRRRPQPEMAGWVLSRLHRGQRRNAGPCGRAHQPGNGSAWHKGCCAGCRVQSTRCSHTAGLQAARVHAALAPYAWRAATRAGAPRIGCSAASAQAPVKRAGAPVRPLKELCRRGSALLDLHSASHRRQGAPNGPVASCRGPVFVVGSPTTPGTYLNKRAAPTATTYLGATALLLPLLHCGWLSGVGPAHQGLG